MKGLYPFFYRFCLNASKARQAKAPASLSYKLSMKASGLAVHLASFCLPKQFSQSKDTSVCLAPPDDKEAPVISLTSYPARIPYIWQDIETLLRQTYRLHAIILWLSCDQFPHLEADLPQSLLALQKRGLSIRFVEGDLRSHKKYFYAFSEFTDRKIIVVDDDVLYPYDTVETLMKLSDTHPGKVCCLIGHEITLDEHDNARPYHEWIANPVGEKEGALICPIGLGGVLYPPDSYDKEVLNREVFMQIAPYADDLWLKLMCLKKGTLAVKADYRIPGFPVKGSQETTLFAYNGKNDNNTRQWNNICERYRIQITKL